MSGSTSSSSRMRIAADIPSTLKAQVSVIGEVLPSFVTGIHKDSVRRWNL